MKNIFLWFLSPVVLVSPLAQAFDINDDYFIDITLSALSQYRSRGISQTQNDPAVQLDTMLMSKKTGLYVGTWTSNIDYGHNSRTRQELDYYAGWYVPFTENVNMDIGYMRYTYPRESGSNMSETYGIFGAYGFKVAAQYSNNYPIFGESQSTLYSWVGYETILPYDFGLLTRYGKMDFKNDVFFSGNSSARSSYREWEVKVSHDWIGLKWALSYVDTDLSRNECNNILGFKDVCTAAIAASISKKF